jgi:hypothetical protein
LANVEYIKVHWIHNSPDYPVLLYSELDDMRFEVRKIEIFPDHSIGFAEGGSSYGGTELGKVSIPQIEEIASDKQFKPENISSEMFDLVWRNRFKKNLPD